MYENYKYLSQMVFNLNLNDNVITNTISPFNEILLFFYLDYGTCENNICLPYY